MPVRPTAPEISRRCNALTHKCSSVPLPFPSPPAWQRPVAPRVAPLRSIRHDIIASALPPRVRLASLIPRLSPGFGLSHARRASGTWSQSPAMRYRSPPALDQNSSLQAFCSIATQSRPFPAGFASLRRSLASVPPCAPARPGQHISYPIHPNRPGPPLSPPLLTVTPDTLHPSPLPGSRTVPCAGLTPEHERAAPPPNGVSARSHSSWLGPTSSRRSTLHSSLFPDPAQAGGIRHAFTGACSADLEPSDWRRR
ncbi:hypothetical protein AcV7_002884 [Taiwanofungus camphoratus]|nr:hypothetical protein AcV7_002884 [Antrodia cinnamomea]